MPTFCPASTITITSTNYMDTYVLPTGITVSAVPPSNVIRTDGTVDSTALNSFVTTFLTQNQASPPTTITPASDMNQAQAFATKSNALRNSMQAEYCWYYNRYIWALTTKLNTVAQPGGATGQSSTATSTALDTNVNNLNRKVNGILLVMKATVNSRMNTLNGYYTQDINSQNTVLDAARQSLAQHSRILQNNDLKSDVQAAMVDYSIEKNSSSRNLLAVYGFMNIVAVGLLFYLYTNTKE